MERREVTHPEDFDRNGLGLYVPNAHKQYAQPPSGAPSIPDITTVRFPKLMVPHTYKPPKKRPVAIDLFAGCGGFSLGFIQAGWEVIAAVEWDSAAIMTYAFNLGAYPMQFVYIDDESRDRLERELKREYKRQEKEAARSGKPFEFMKTGGAWRASHPDEPGVRYMFVGDIRKLDGEVMLSDLDMKPGQVDCVMGGPPCQGFSHAGRRNVYDPRNSLVFEFARMVCQIQPSFFVMENVPGMLSMTTIEGLNLLAVLAQVFSDGGMGTYDALREGLLASPGAGAGVRGVHVSGGEGDVKSRRAAAIANSNADVSVAPVVAPKARAKAKTPDVPQGQMSFLD